MNARRWQHLDRQPRAEEPAAPAAPEGAAGEPARRVHPSPALADDLRLSPARAYWQLGQLERCAECLEQVLAGDPQAPGAHRLLGLALGRLRDLPGALSALEAAAALAPDDEETRASLLSLRLLGGIAPAEEPAYDPTVRSLGELTAAAAWMRGRELLEARRDREAAVHFEVAARLFSRHSPPELRAERLGAAYVSAGIALGLAGDTAAAQQAYARTVGRESAGATAAEFARRLYQVAEAAAALDDAERETELAPLRALITGSRLRVLFYDQSHPVALRWENLPFLP
ncbi:MAG: hypothetical protein ACK47B_04045 [Armatimonadota bacterium]